MKNQIKDNNVINLNITKIEIMKLLGILVITLIFDVLVHQIAKLIREDNMLTLEIIQSKLLLIILDLSGIFISVIITFICLQKYLMGSRIEKGFKFGIAFGVFFVYSFFEMCLLWDYSLFEELINGLADGIPMFFMCILLGLLVGIDTKPASEMERMSHSSIQNKIQKISIIGIVYLVGRYIGYICGDLFGTFYSAYLRLPIETFFWTLSWGLWIGVMYILLLEQLEERIESSMRLSLFFGLIFGIPWFIYTLFIPLIVDPSFFLDAIIRATVDIISVVIGVYIVQKFNKDSKLIDSDSNQS